MFCNHVCKLYGALAISTMVALPGVGCIENTDARPAQGAPRPSVKNSKVIEADDLYMFVELATDSVSDQESKQALRIGSGPAMVHTIIGQPLDVAEYSFEPRISWIHGKYRTSSTRITIHDLDHGDFAEIFSTDATCDEQLHTLPYPDPDRGPYILGYECVTLGTVSLEDQAYFMQLDSQLMGCRAVSP